MCYRLEDESLRQELKRPLGALLRGNEVSRFLAGLPKGAVVITVGDMTTENAVRMGVRPKVEVVDMKEKRSPRGEPASSAARQVRVRNDPGTISLEAMRALEEALKAKEPVRLVVEGEEDLLALPAIILAPDGSYVLYGQPNEGMVCVEVSEGARERARRLLGMFRLGSC